MIQRTLAAYLCVDHAVGLNLKALGWKRRKSPVY